MTSHLPSWHSNSSVDVCNCAGARSLGVDHMRSRWLVVLIVLSSVAVFAQVPVPGTFTTVSVQQVQAGAPLLSPPIASLGNGLTPTVIVTKQSVLVGAPQNVPIEPETVADTASMGSSVASPETEGQQSGRQRASRQPKSFDFIVESGTSGMVANDDSHSLGEVARNLRKGARQAIAGRTFTNDDIDRINQRTTTPGTAPNTPPSEQKAPGQGANSQ